MTFQPGRFFWKLFLVNAALAGMVLTLCVSVILRQFDRFYEAELSRHLLVNASALAAAVGDRFDGAHAADLQRLAAEVGATGLKDLRVTFVLTGGRVIGDSRADPATMESHADRPEIRQALATGVGESTRWSHTLGKNLKYVAVRVGSATGPRGIVRVAMAVESIGARAEPAQRLMVVMALVSVLALVLLALGIALLWSRRIAQITEAARSLSRGDLSARVAVAGRDEVAALGQSLNEMRERLAQHLETIDRQRRTLDSLVSELREGVIVADDRGRIVLMNAEAVRLLHGAPPEGDDAVVGLAMERCVPQPRLQRMLRTDDQRVASLDDDRPRATGDEEPGRQSSGNRGGQPAAERNGDREIRLQIQGPDQSRIVLARAFDVRLPPDKDSVSDSNRGRALILTDVTELTKVMQVKADLAANASHELRTPLSAIRAAIDTLRTVGRLDDAESVAPLIDVLDRHSHRMEAMIDDLLSLSRLEAEADRFEVSSIPVAEWVESLRAGFAEALARKGLRWHSSISDNGLTVRASPELLRMILCNLIDNAIQFTEPGGEVRLSVSSDQDGVTFEVADTGRGIPPDQQRRVFERFYQVERARSGPHRGTGLGLSIVRHAAAAMKATVLLESEVGRGTRVLLTIPKPT